MISQESNTVKTLLVFDAQLTGISQKTLQKLRSSLLNTEKHAWLRDIVAGLPRFWETASVAAPEVQDERVTVLLNNLNAWLRQGDPISFPLPNVLLTPITVIVELVQFVDYLGEENLPWPSPGIHETVGFCTGLLSAFVASLSANVEDLKKRGAAAVRLALLIGAVVDQQNQCDSETSIWGSFSVGWSSQEQKNGLDQFLDRAHEVSQREGVRLVLTNYPCALSTDQGSCRYTSQSLSTRTASLSLCLALPCRTSPNSSHNLDSAWSGWIFKAAFTATPTVALSKLW